MVGAFVGAAQSDWRPQTPSHRVIDDLDAGFAVENDRTADGPGLLGRFRPPTHFDRGLPQFSWLLLGSPDAGWLRQEAPSSWGKYRHTVARAAAADGHAMAVFAAELPGGGEWRLDYHMPFVRQPQRGVRLRGEPQAMVAALGDYDMVLEFGNGERRSIMFDATGAEMGWNDLGRFELPKGQVRLVVSNRTSGDVVLADAIRWRGVAGFASNKE